jgi:hypothetical protein
MSIDDKEKEVVSDCLIVLKENAKYGHKTKISELQQALSRIIKISNLRIKIGICKMTYYLSVHCHIRSISSPTVELDTYEQHSYLTHYKRLYNKNKIVLMNLLETIITDHEAMSIDDKEKEVVSDCLIVLKENAKYGHKRRL